MGKIETRKYADRAEYLKRQVRERRKLLRKRLIELFGGCCVICGYKKYCGALHFHHKDPTTKKFAINERELGKKWEVLVEEAMKCVLLCGNCHAEVHAGVSQLPKDSPVAQRQSARLLSGMQ
jgi:predicted HNH restriction endonuclease